MKYLPITALLLLFITACTPQEETETHYTSLSEALKNPKDALSLMLNHQPNLDNLDSIAYLTNLKELTISNLSYTSSNQEIPKQTLFEKIGMLTQLEELWIAHDKLYALPESIVT